MLRGRGYGRREFCRKSMGQAEETAPQGVFSMRVESHVGFYACWGYRPGIDRMASILPWPGDHLLSVAHERLGMPALHLPVTGKHPLVSLSRWPHRGPMNTRSMKKKKKEFHSAKDIIYSLLNWHFSMYETYLHKISLARPMFVFTLLGIFQADVMSRVLVYVRSSISLIQCMILF